LKPGRLISPPGTYFLTFSTHQRRRLFVVDAYSRLFLKTLYHYRRECRYALHAFVVMPDHVHLMLTPAHDVTVERAVQLIKGGYSHALGTLIGRNFEIWQRGFTDHRLRDAQDFVHHRNYVHRNPVVAKLAIVACEFRCCSAFPGFKLDPWPQRLKPLSLKALQLARVELVPFPVLPSRRFALIPDRALFQLVPDQDENAMKRGIPIPIGSSSVRPFPRLVPPS
jgi:putative transposase